MLEVIPNGVSFPVTVFEMGWDRQLASKDCKGALDLVITNAIVDWIGVYKVRVLLSFFTQYTLDDPSQADIGVCDGIIVGTGKAGNQDDLDCVDPCLVIGSSAKVIAGKNLIITAHAIDAYVLYTFVHSLSPRSPHGTMTMNRGGAGPSMSTNATTCTSSLFYIQHMLAATDGLPMNFAFTGKGDQELRRWKRLVRRT